MSYNPRQVTLKEITTKIGSGATPRGGNEVYKESGISLIRSQNVLDFEFSYDGLAHIDEEQALGLKNVDIQKNDILLNITGDSVARCCVVPPDILPARVNQHVAIIRVNNNVADSQYIKYFLLSPVTKRYLLSLAAHGGTRNALTKNMLQNIEVNLPTLEYQKKVSRLLAVLDRKIELNNRMNKVLEEMAKAIFKRWFVEFEFSNENGEPYKSSGGKLVDSEMGLIPAGWQAGHLRDLVKVQNGYAFKSKDFRPSGKIGIIKIKNISSNYVDIINTDYIDDDIANEIDDKFLVEAKSILIAMTGAEVCKIGLVPKTTKRLYLNQRVGMFKEIVEGGKEFCYFLLSDKNIQDNLKGQAYGSAQPNISASQIEQLKVVVPDIYTVREFGKIIKPLFDKTCDNLHLNYILSELRNTLLPKLMSGEIDVSQVEL